MRFTFLGTGTSSGVPMIACSCAVCTSTDPRDHRLRTGACLEFTDPDGCPRVILIDCTPDIRVQALRAGLMRCDAVVFTHNHVDHTFGVDELRRFNAVQDAPIEIHADPHTMESLTRIYKHIFESDRNVNQSFVASLVPRLIDPSRPIDLFGLRFTPIPLLHGRLPILGFRIDSFTPSPREGAGGGFGSTPLPEGRAGDRRSSSSSNPHIQANFLPLAYCTDVSEIPESSYPLLRGLHTLVLDALRHKPHPTHQTIAQATAAAQRIAARQTYFVHMTHDLAHEPTNAALPAGVQLAYDGLRLGMNTPTGN